MYEKYEAALKRKLNGWICDCVITVNKQVQCWSQRHLLKFLWLLIIFAVQDTWKIRMEFHNIFIFISSDNLIHQQLIIIKRLYGARLDIWIFKRLSDSWIQLSDNLLKIQISTLMEPQAVPMLIRPLTTEVPVLIKFPNHSINAQAQVMADTIQITWQLPITRLTAIAFEAVNRDQQVAYGLWYRFMGGVNTMLVSNK